MGNTTINNIFSDTIAEIEKAYNHNGMTGIPTGFRDLDEMTGGWKPAELIVISAPYAMGKTAFALSMMRNMAVEHGIGVAYFSLDSSAQSLMTQLIASETKIQRAKLQKGTLTKEELERVKTQMEQLSNAPIYIDDTANITDEEFEYRCVGLHFDYDVQVFIIDDLKLMATAQNFRFKKKHIAQTLASLKETAEKYNVTIIVLSRLTSKVKGGEHISDYYPKLNDILNGLETINNIADKICFLYRPEYYGCETDEYGKSTRGLARFVVAKSRNRGYAEDEISLRFLGEFRRFENWDVPLENDALKE
jgi:replicative DNA helicase